MGIELCGKICEGCRGPWRRGKWQHAGSKQDNLRLEQLRKAVVK